MSNEPIEGYPILPPLGDLRLTRIADLQPYAKALTCRFIVLRRVDDPKIVKEGGAVFTYLVADDSASVVANFWNEVGESIKPGDIMLLTSGFVTMYKNRIRLACKLGAIVRLGRFNMSFSESPNVSEDHIYVPNPLNDRELIKKSCS